jgi:hypothetical protein
MNPTRVNAMQFTGDNIDAFGDFLFGGNYVGCVDHDKWYEFHHASGETWMVATPGRWVVKDPVTSIQTVLSPQEFARQFSLVDGQCRYKPLVVRALQYTGENSAEFLQFMYPDHYDVMNWMREHLSAEVWFYRGVDVQVEGLIGRDEFRRRFSAKEGEYASTGDRPTFE